jgi:hypothetical protein
MDVEPETITMNKFWTIRISVAAPPLFAIFLGVAFLLGINDALAQRVLDMRGIEKIDSKERISGNAVVGFSKNCDDFDPSSVHVFTGTGSKTVELTTRLTTVDGRYIFNATLPKTKISGWYRLDLKKEITESGDEVARLNTTFLDDYRDEQIALLVVDGDGRVYPVHCSCQSNLEAIRIQVNAEGADAYYPQLVENKRALKACTRVQKSSNFKFDHYCDLKFEDIDKVETFPIIRKRGATIANRITIKTEIPAQFENAQEIYERCTAEPGDI